MDCTRQIEIAEHTIRYRSPTRESRASVDDIYETLHWFTNHFKSLSDSSGGESQLDYLDGLIFPRLNAYRDNVEHNLRARRAPRTWGESDTLNLPYNFDLIVRGHSQEKYSERKKKYC